MKFILLALISNLILVNSFAVDLTEEIKLLNRDYGRVMDYPIVIFDKKEVVPLVTGKSESESSDIIKKYLLDKYEIQATDNEAYNLVPYFTVMNGSAVALPFFQGTWRDKRVHFCAVLPNGNDNDLKSEVRRILGHDPRTNVYDGFDFSYFEENFTLEELYLFSLYHELSHCLDTYFLPKNYEGEPSGHGVHKSESFAEVNALFLLAQRKGMKRLGAKRSLIRTTYSKYMGPYFADSDTPIFGGQLVKQGGAIYFLTPALLAAQRKLEDFNRDVIDFSLDQTLELSREIVDHHAINSRSFHALFMAYQDGFEDAGEHYKKMAQEAPELFLNTYYDLMFYQTLIEASL